MNILYTRQSGINYYQVQKQPGPHENIALRAVSVFIVLNGLGMIIYDPGYSECKNGQLNYSRQTSSILSRAAQKELFSGR
jgi:hypothetical protein